MTPMMVAEGFLDVGAQVIHKREFKKLLDFLQGESQLMKYLYGREQETVYPKDISKILEVSPARVALLLNRLQRKGWIERNDDPKDSRRTTVELTADGKREFERRKLEVLEYINDLIDRIGLEESDRILNFSKKFIT